MYRNSRGGRRSNWTLENDPVLTKEEEPVGAVRSRGRSRGSGDKPTYINLFSDEEDEEPVRPKRRRQMAGTPDPDYQLSASPIIPRASTRATRTTGTVESSVDTRDTLAPPNTTAATAPEAGSWSTLPPRSFIEVDRKMIVKIKFDKSRPRFHQWVEKSEPKVSFESASEIGREEKQALILKSSEELISHLYEAGDAEPGVIVGGSNSALSSVNTTVNNNGSSQSVFVTKKGRAFRISEM